MRRRLVPVVLVTLAAALGACNGDEPQDANDPPSAQPPETAIPEPGGEEGVPGGEDQTGTGQPGEE